MQPAEILLTSLRKFADSIEGERRADVLMDGVGTGVQARYFSDRVMELEGLPELPPILRFEQNAVKALLQGQLKKLNDPKEINALNIYRFFDPRTVLLGLASGYRYNEQTHCFEADLDLGKAQQGFEVDNELMAWLKSHGRLIQSVEFVLADNEIRRMTLLELPPSQQKITLVFSPQIRG